MLSSILTSEFQTFAKGSWMKPIKKLQSIDECEQLVFGLKMFVKQEFRGVDSVAVKVKELLETLKQAKR